MTRIEVKHLQSATSAVAPHLAPAKPFVNSSPCVQIGFFWDPNLKANQPVSFSPCWALVDTGADGVYVDHELIQRYNCPVAVGGDEITVNNQPGSKAHRGTIFVIEEGRSIDMWVLARDFKGQASPFSVVLGRRFLQFCNLHWDGPNQMVTLDIGENPKAF